jgi:hypothetical protein
VVWQSGVQKKNRRDNLPIRTMVQWKKFLFSKKE